MMDLDHAESRVEFWTGRAIDAEQLGRTDLVIAFLRLAQTWARIAERERAPVDPLYVPADFKEVSIRYGEFDR